jgi:serine protease Do
LNLQGDVVGINTAIVSRSGGYMGIGFAIPITMAQRIQEQLVKTGRVARGYLGVRIQDVTQELAASFHLARPEGVLVAEVPKGTPAAHSGLRAGDVIVAVGEQPVQNTGHLRNLVAMMPPQTRVALDVLRDGKRQTLSVVLGELPDRDRVSSAPPTDLQPRLGVAVQDLTPDLAQKFGYDAGQGVLVAHVAPRSPAARAGLRRGMRILAVNNQPVASRAEFLQALGQTEQTARFLLLVQHGRGTQFMALRLS